MAYTDEFGQIFGDYDDIITYGDTVPFANTVDPDTGAYIPIDADLSSSMDWGSAFDLSPIAGLSTQALNTIKGLFTKDGKTDWRAVATAGGALLPLISGGGGSSGSRPSGYQGGIPQYTAVREALPMPAADRRPGSGGQRYFTDVQFVKPAAAPAAQETTGIETVQPAVEPYARGGIVNLQDGGFVIPADVVSHLGNGSTDAGIAKLKPYGAVPIYGKGDGMSDSNRTTINGRQPAAVADGEAYFGPKEVKDMGGSQALYAMMDQVRKDRTGTTKQGRQINPDKYLPRQA